MNSEKVTISLYKNDTFHIDENLASQINRATHPLLSAYIFNNEKPHFIQKSANTKSEENAQKTPKTILKSAINIGDNIEDEWFLAFLAFQLTRRFPITASLRDGDGDFLLIEAADFLPKGISSQNNENRTFVKNGQIHYMRMKKRKTVEETLKSLWNEPEELTQVDADFSDCIFERFSAFERKLNAINPAKEKINGHFSNIKAPFRVAKAFRLCPELIQKAAEKFCLRSFDQNGAIRKLKRFKPAKGEICYERLNFSRFSFAQTVSARDFYNDQFEEVGFGDSEKGEFSVEESLGVKLSCGLELLLEEVEEWEEANGVFGVETIELGHSQFVEERSRFREKLLNLSDSVVAETTIDELFKIKILAENSLFLRKMALSAKITKCPPSSVLWGKYALVADAEIPMDRFEKNAENLPESDKTEWMEIDPTELDGLIMGKLDLNDETHGFSQVDNLIHDLESFMTKNSDYEGIESIANDLDFNERDFSDYSGDKDETTCKLMDEMDQELAQTNIAKSFINFGNNKEMDTADITVNLANNIASSLAEQEGGHGPASSLLADIKNP